jgi:hypothetical protein
VCGHCTTLNENRSFSEYKSIKPARGHYSEPNEGLEQFETESFHHLINRNEVENCNYISMGAQNCEGHSLLVLNRMDLSELLRSIDQEELQNNAHAL